MPRASQPEQGVFVITVDPDGIGQGRSHATSTAPAMTAIAACSHVPAITFLCDAGEVRVGTFQLTFRRACHPLQRGDGSRTYDLTA